MRSRSEWKIPRIAAVLLLATQAPVSAQVSPTPPRGAKPAGGSSLSVEVTDAGLGRGIPCRITVVDERGALAPLSVDRSSKLAARPGVVYTPGRPGRDRARRRGATRSTRLGDSNSAWTRTTVNLTDGGAGKVRLAIRREVPDRRAHRLRHARPHIHPQRPRRRDGRRTGRDPGRRGDRVADRHRPRPSDRRPRRRRRSHGRAGLLHARRRRRGDDAGRPLQRVPAPDRPGAPPGNRADRLGRDPPRHPVGARRAGRRAQPPAGPPRQLPTVRPGALQPGHGPSTPRADRRRCDRGHQLRRDAVRPDASRSATGWRSSDHGERSTAVGASDSHDVARHIVGQGRTYIDGRDEEPARIDVDAAARTSARAGHW